MPDQQTLFAIVLMAATTYLTRISAWLILRNRTLTPGAMAVLRSSPGCVMLAFIAPYFASGNFIDLIGLGVTFIAAIRFSMPVTAIIGVLATALLRHYFSL